jgi:hypothetical protein
VEPHLIALQTLTEIAIQKRPLLTCSVEASLGGTGKHAVAACSWRWKADCRPWAETGSGGQNSSSVSKLVKRRGGAFLTVRLRCIPN